MLVIFMSKIDDHYHSDTQIKHLKLCCAIVLKIEEVSNSERIKFRLNRPRNINEFPLKNTSFWFPECELRPLSLSPSTRLCQISYTVNTHLPNVHSVETSVRRPSWSTGRCSSCRQTLASSLPADLANWFDWIILTSSSWRWRNLQIWKKGAKMKN